MSHFYVELQGGLSHKSARVSRRAHVGYGAETIAASWHGCVRCVPYVNDNGIDCVRVTRESWKGSGGPMVVLYDGPFSFDPLDGAAYSTDLV